MKQLIMALLGVAMLVTQANAGWSNKVRVSGLFEAEALIYKGYTKSDDIQDIIVATAEVGLEASISTGLDGTIVFLYEEDDTPFDVEQAFLDWQTSESFTLSVGQMYIPFGNFDTTLVNDPFTLAVGESLETVIVGTLEVNHLTIKGYVFNGDISDVDDEGEKINSVGIRLQYEADNHLLGVDYSNNIMDSDGLQESIGPTVNDLAAGYSIYFSSEFSRYLLILEYLSALDVVVAANEPSSIQFELAYNKSIEGYSFAYQKTEELAFFGLPESRISLGYSRVLDSNLFLATELFMDEDYSVKDGGTNKSSIGLVVQLGIEF